MTSAQRAHATGPGPDEQRISLGGGGARRRRLLDRRHFLGLQLGQHGLEAVALGSNSTPRLFLHLILVGGAPSVETPAPMLHEAAHDTLWGSVAMQMSWQPRRRRRWLPTR